jgi:hypothetical protein
MELKRKTRLITCNSLPGYIGKFALGKIGLPVRDGEGNYFLRELRFIGFGR